MKAVNKSKNIQKLASILLGATCFVSISNAMVIRHDVPKEKYVLAEADFPAIFPISDDGKIKNCVATLIAPQWAITAAHCTILINKESLNTHPYSVNIGSKKSNISNYFTPKEFGRFNVSRDENNNITGVEPATEMNFQYDMALLKLEKPVTHVKSISTYQDNNEIGKEVLLLGWGDFSTGDIGIDEAHPVNDGKFRQAWNQVTSVDKNRLKFIFDDPRPDNTKALPLEGVNGPGDSGGPALAMTSTGYKVLAVSSGGDYPSNMTNIPKETGQYGWEESYIRTSMMNDWITTTMDENK
jgi:hypothetical protein